MGVPTGNEVKVNYGLGIRAGATFRTSSRTRPAPLTCPRFDNGQRQLPGDFPAHLHNVTDAGQLAALGRGLPNNWTAQTGSARARPALRPDAFAAASARNGKNSYGSITSIDYSSTYASWMAKNYNYNSLRPGRTAQRHHLPLQPTTNVHSVRTSILHNWTALIGRRPSSVPQPLQPAGREPHHGAHRPEHGGRFGVRNFAYRCQQRTIYSGQLRGSHELVNDRSKLDWALGCGRALSQEPDFRRVRTVRSIDARRHAVPSGDRPLGFRAGRRPLLQRPRRARVTGELDFERKVTQGGRDRRGPRRAPSLTQGPHFSARWIVVQKASSSSSSPAISRLLGEIFADAATSTAPPASSWRKARTAATATPPRTR